MKKIAIVLLIVYGTFAATNNNIIIRALYEHDRAEAIRLIQWGVDANERGDAQQSPMHLASELGYIEVVALLINQGYKNQITSMDKWGNTPLHIASEFGRENIVKLLIENGANVNAAAERGWTPLYSAIVNGHEYVAKLLIENGVDVHHKIIIGHTALHYTAQKGSENVAKLLIEKGANVNDKTNDGATPLILAAEYGKENVAKLLIGKGANLEDETNIGFTPLHIAAYKGKENVAKLLIENGADVHHRTNNGHTSLHLAAESGNENIAKLLIERGANIEDKTKIGITPLAIAAEYGKENVAKLLIEKGADIHHRTNNGHTPLHATGKSGNENIAKLLMEKGANVHDKTNSGATPLVVAAYYGKENVAKLLIENGANVNAKLNTGYTSLHQAAQNGFDKVVQLLLNAGADINARTNLGKTPKDLAEENNQQKILDILDVTRRVEKINQYIENVCERYRSDKPGNYISGGQLAVPNEFPWMTALGYFNLKSNTIDYRCGGTIISEHFILTAAHCTDSAEQPVIVRVGTIHLNDPEYAKKYYIERIIKHDEYSTETKKNDIALIRVQKTIEISRNVRPACLETDTRDKSSDEKLKVAGWGITSSGLYTPSEQLLTAEVTTNPLSECNTTYVNYNRKINHSAFQDGITEGQYCAHDPVRKINACQGDSGGPLQSFDDVKTARVVGVVSFGIGCGDPQFPAIYTRVAHYTDWIASHVWPNVQNNSFVQ